MKKIIFLIVCNILFADITPVIVQIKQIENLKKTFLKYPNYNIFINKSTVHISNTVTKYANPTFQIYAIFNNKADINGIWKTIGDYVNNYKIIKIYSNRIILKNGNKFITLRSTPKIIKAKK